MASKLLDDEIPQERYEKLREFIELLAEQQGLGDSEWIHLHGEDGLEELFMRDDFIDDQAEDDDIEVLEGFFVLSPPYGFIKVM